MQNDILIYFYILFNFYKLYPPEAAVTVTRGTRATANLLSLTLFMRQQTKDQRPVTKDYFSYTRNRLPEFAAAVFRRT
jgi:hypothetical protein